MYLQLDEKQAVRIIFRDDTVRTMKGPGMVEFLPESQGGARVVTAHDLDGVETQLVLEREQFILIEVTPPSRLRSH